MTKINADLKVSRSMNSEQEESESDDSFSGDDSLSECFKGRTVVPKYFRHL